MGMSPSTPRRRARHMQGYTTNKSPVISFLHSDKSNQDAQRLNEKLSLHAHGMGSLSWHASFAYVLVLQPSLSLSLFHFGSQLFSGAARSCHGEGSIENVRRV